MLTGSASDYDRAICCRAEPFLRCLAAETKTSAVLSVWRGRERYVLLRIADDSSVTVNRDYPESKEIYRTATGIVLFAFREEDMISAHIEAYGIPNNANPSDAEIEEFRKTLALCRKNGYYVREKEGIWEAAAILRDGRGELRTAVGIFLPRFRAEEPKNLISSLLETVSLLEREENC